MVLCDVLSADRAELIALWTEVFSGDPPAFPEKLLALLPRLGCGFAAVEAGKVLGAAYWIDDLMLAGEKAGYLFGVAVLPQARGRGIGAALSRACFAAGQERGSRWLTIEPAEPSLFDWYADIVGTAPVLYRQKRSVAADACCPLQEISASRYFLRREELLAGRPHLRYGEAAQALEEENNRLFSGGFYETDGAIATAFLHGAKLLSREALGAQPEALLASLAALRGAREATLLSSADSGAPFLAANAPLPAGTVWNLAFD